MSHYGSMFSSDKLSEFLRRYQDYVPKVHEVSARGADAHVLQVPAVADPILTHIERCLCATFWNHARDIGRK